MATVGRYRVPNGKLGIVRRHYGKSDPRFKKVTPYDLVGWQARTLLPNSAHWLTPGVYSVEYVDPVFIPDLHIGIVTALEGANRPRGHMVGRYVACDDFQDGQRFLLSGGEQGTQIATLAGGQTYYLNPHLFHIEIVPLTSIPSGTIGLVTAIVGRAPRQGARFARHVDCDNFQNGLDFLNAGGEQGRQLAILAGGAHYDINPRLFSVTTFDNAWKTYQEHDPSSEQLQDIQLEMGEIGVVVTLDGAEPDGNQRKKVGSRIPGHQSFQLPWVFLENGGTRGVQEETLDGGSVVSLNPWFVRVLVIPTRLLLLEWNDKTPSEAANNYDAKLERLVVTIQGHRLRVEVSQSVRIPEAAAPRLVSEFGGSSKSIKGGLVHDRQPVQRFVERVLGATVEAFFSQIAAESTIQEFLQGYSEIRTDLAAQVRNALAEWEVEAVETKLGTFEAEDPELNRALQGIAAGQLENERLVVERGNAWIKDEIDAVEINKDQRRAAIQLESELKILIAALGPDNAALIHMIREMTKMPVPDYIGGGDISGLVQALPIGALQNLIGQLDKLRPAARLENTPPPAALERDAIPTAGQEDASGKS